MSLQIDFRGMDSCSVGNGRTVRFWDDMWNGELGLLKIEFP